MPLIRSSLTLQANLFHEFHPMGGVSARFADGEVFSCAIKPLTRSNMHAKDIDRIFRIFMHTFYQKRPWIGTARYTREV